MSKFHKSRETVWWYWCGYVRPFRIYPHLQEQNVSWDWMCFLITGFAAEFRFGNYGFGRDVKVLTVCKMVLAVNKNISISSNR